MVKLMPSDQRRPIYHIRTFLLIIAQNQETFPHVLNFRPCSAGPFLKRGAVAIQYFLKQVAIQYSSASQSRPEWASSLSCSSHGHQLTENSMQSPAASLSPCTGLDFELHCRFICALPISSNRWKPTQKLLQRFCYIELKIWGYISWPLAAVKHRSLKSSNAQWALLTFSHILYSLCGHR